MKTMLAAIAIAFAVPAMAQTAPVNPHTGHNTAAHAQQAAPQAGACTPEHAAMGHCTLKAAPAPGASHDAKGHDAKGQGKSDGEMPCCEKDADGKMACCEKMKAKGAKMGCCEKMGGNSAGGHAGQKAHGGHSGH